MTDLEITRLCAEAMGFAFIAETGTCCYAGNDPRQVREEYRPLHDDAQAMALVKKFKIGIGREDGDCMWAVGRIFIETINKDLNRAICECVAEMQTAKK